jgi:flagellar basal-body rod protein FlgB
MIDALLSQPSFVAASKMLDATAMRHEAIASNLANIATPGYRRVDLNPTFDAELRQALGSGDVAALNRIQPKIEADPSAQVEGPNGNSVQLEDELMYMSQNMMAHSLNVQIVNGSIDRLKMAITGRQA